MSEGSAADKVITKTSTACGSGTRAESMKATPAKPHAPYAKSLACSEAAHFKKVAFKRAPF